MVVVPAFSRSEQCDEGEIRGSVVEIAFAEGVIRAVDYSVEENIGGGLHKVGKPSPGGSKQQHENRDARDYTRQPKAKNMAVEPAVADVRRKRSQRLRLLRLARVIVDVPKQNAP